MLEWANGLAQSCQEWTEYSGEAADELPKILCEPARQGMYL